MPGKGEGSEMTPHGFITSQSPSGAGRILHKMGKINKANHHVNQTWQMRVCKFWIRRHLLSFAFVLKLFVFYCFAYVNYNPRFIVTTSSSFWFSLLSFLCAITNVIAFFPYKNVSLNCVYSILCASNDYFCSWWIWKLPSQSVNP